MIEKQNIVSTFRIVDFNSSIVNVKLVYSFVCLFVCVFTVLVFQLFDSLVFPLHFTAGPSALALVLSRVVLFRTALCSLSFSLLYDLFLFRVVPHWFQLRCCMVFLLLVF